MKEMGRNLLGNVVGAVGEGRGGSGQDLEIGVCMFGLVVVMRGSIVDCFDVTNEHRLLGLVGDDILVDTVENNGLGIVKEVLRGIEGLVGIGSSLLLNLIRDWGGDPDVVIETGILLDVVLDTAVLLVVLGNDTVG